MAAATREQRLRMNAQAPGPDFDAFVAAEWQGMVRAAFIMGADHQEAEDLVQDTLVACLNRWPRMSRVDDPKAYAYRVLINKLKRHKRTARVTFLEDASDDHPVADVPRTVSLDSAAAGRLDLRAILQQLPSDQRAVIVLRHLLQLTVQETAAALKVPPGTVKSRSSRALEYIRLKLGEDYR